MLFKEFNPLEKKQLQIMNEQGEIVRPDLMPDIEPEAVVQLYKMMVMTRIADTKALQFQRQGRMLTYAPNLGQEAAQVGSIAATEHTDWMASAFRELGAWLYRKVPLFNILLYWYGNEEGMKMPEGVKVLPVSVPIASQFQHAVGLAYASKYNDKGEVAIAYVGDGGTSQGDFHEALNFASTMKLPNVFIIQNNQFAISVPRRKQTGAATLAQKAIAYDMPGIQVDGNDVFAVYAASKEAVERARSGEGPSLIEAFTYRMGAHTTADDPTRYREDAEVEEWRAKDPVDRLFKYLVAQGLWDQKLDEAFKNAYEKEVRLTFEQVEDTGTIDLESVFAHQYSEMTPQLRDQLEERRLYYEEGR